MAITHEQEKDPGTRKLAPRDGLMLGRLVRDDQGDAPRHRVPSLD